MTTSVTYTLYFSRENSYLPFLTKDTVVYKGWKIVHSHSATIMARYDWELKSMYEDFRAFQHEAADTTKITYQTLDCCKTMIVCKTWEG